MTDDVPIRLPESALRLASSPVVRDLLTRHHYRVSKSLGQNFLCDPAALRSMVEAARPEGESVIEVGPGLGVLTLALADSARAVLAVEVAKRLIPVLDETLAGMENIRVLNEDFLATSTDEFSAGPWVMASNLPYAITTPALFRFFDGEIPWKRMAITVQAELADRLAAAPGGKDYGALTVSAQAAASIEIIRRVPSSSFWPRPRVASAIVRCVPHQGRKRPEGLRDLLRKAFSARRKTLRNGLHSVAGALEVMMDLGIDPGLRPEVIGVDEWMALATKLEMVKGAS